MSDYDVGYGKPPERSRFKPGVSGNPKGRPKRRPIELAGLIERVLNAPMAYRERGRTRTTTRQELALRKLIEDAVKGDPGAAEQILQVRAYAKRLGDVGVTRLQIADWLPDYAGQTAEQKTQEVAGTDSAPPLEWWHPPKENDE
jgi:Family of unknown function (DUF5681)